MGRPLRVTHADRVAHCTIHAIDEIWFDDRDREVFMATLRTLVARHGYVIEYFSILSTHCHFEMRFFQDKSCGDIMGNINGCLSKAYNKITGRKGHLWRERYKDFHIDTDDYYWSCIIYIALNKLKAGAVKNIDEDISSSWNFYAYGIEDGITTTSQHYRDLGDTPQQRQREFRLMVNEAWKAWQDNQTWEDVQDGKEAHVGKGRVNMVHVLNMFEEEEEFLSELKAKETNKRNATPPDASSSSLPSSESAGETNASLETDQSRHRAYLTYQAEKFRNATYMMSRGIPYRAFKSFWANEDFIVDFVNAHYDKFGMASPPETDS